MPSAEAPKQITLDEAPIAFIKAHQGHERFLDFGVLYPNWGSQYGLYEISQVDLPFPHAYADYLANVLYPSLTPSNQFTIHGGMAGIIFQEKNLIAHFGAFEDASVKYLLFPHQVPIDPALTRLGVKEVFRDSLAAIYEMPSPRPFVSASSPSCIVSVVSVNHTSVLCPKGPATLLRTELSMPGWSATVNGRPAAITTIDGVYQSIEVPAGASKVRYFFRPPHETLALVLAGLALIFSIATWALSRRRRSHPPQDAAPDVPADEPPSSPAPSSL